MSGKEEMRIIIDINGNKVISAVVVSSPVPIDFNEVGTIAESAPFSQDVPSELLVRAKEMGATSAGRAQIDPSGFHSAALETLRKDSLDENYAIDAGTLDPVLRSMTQESHMQMEGKISGNIETIDAGKPLTSSPNAPTKKSKRGIKNG